MRAAARIAVSLLVLAGCRTPEQSEPSGGETATRRAPERATVRDPEGRAAQHTLRFPEPHTHYIEVESVFPTDGDPAVVLFMPVWTPGSYLVREFARNVEELRASTVDGEPLESEKVRKNRWRVTTGGADRVVVRYRLYARVSTVQSSFVDDSMAVLNNAGVFLSLVDDEPRPQDLTLEVPDGWEQIVTGLGVHPDGPANRFLASDWDQLVDAPIVAGNPVVSTFEVEGVEHVLASFGGERYFDQERAARDLEALVRTQVEFWGDVPYDRYLFLNVLNGRGGGLEHYNSTLCMASPFATRTREQYRRWLGLMSHEFFHTWNVKRLRPEVLGPFDYENEIHTTSLWIAEGITSYYDDLLLLRAGLMDRDEYLDTLSEQINRVQTTPGRLVQPLSRSSWDTWIKFYRPDENSGNTRISYYRKGAVVGFLIDAAIRAETNGVRSLDDVMRVAYERHSGDRGYSEEEFRGIVDEVAGASLGELVAAMVDGTGELTYDAALAHYGLAFEEVEEPDEDDDVAGYLGVETEDRGGRNVITGVERETPAYAAGLNVDDELLAIDDYRLASGGLGEHLARYSPGDEVEILVARRGPLRRLRATLGEAPRQSWALEIVDRPSGVQRAYLGSWLSVPEEADEPDEAAQ